MISYETIFSVKYTSYIHLDFDLPEWQNEKTLQISLIIANFVTLLYNICT